MDLRATLWTMAGFAALGVFCGWRGARRPDFRRGPRMMPWRWLMLTSAAAELLLLIHLLNILQNGE